jgi:putative acetyltransferase
MTPWRRRARQQGIRSLFSEASELARRLFEREGFAVVERQDLVVRSVAITITGWLRPWT